MLTNSCVRAILWYYGTGTVFTCCNMNLYFVVGQVKWIKPWSWQGNSYRMAL